MSSTEPLSLVDLERCFGGAIPAVLATASAEGVVNVTYLSRAHRVDGERIALSNQFMSKTSRNLTTNPRASLLLMDPVTHDEFRLSLVYERTERRGPVFEQLRADVDALAALSNMSEVFRLRAADVFRVTAVEQNPPNPSGSLPTDTPPDRASSAELAGLSELAGYIARASDLDMLVETALEGLDRLLGYRHTLLLLVDEGGTRLYTIASRGFDTQSLGAEVEIGSGQIGLAAARCEPLRIGGLRVMEKYAESVRRQLDDGMGPGHDVPVPGVVGVQSRIVVPAMARGELIGVLVAESRRPVAFGAVDEQVLCVVGSMLASAIEHVRAVELDDADSGVVTRPGSTSPRPAVASSDGVPFRFFAVDGSVFVDGDYLIKGVAGRILWSLLHQYAADGRLEFTNRELRLDPTLDLPGFKDNLESRLILLKRRLDERKVPVRIEKTGRGRFRLVVSVVPQLEFVDP